MSLITRGFSNHFCDTFESESPPLCGGLVFGVRPFLLYHRSGFHFNHSPGGVKKAAHILSNCDPVTVIASLTEIGGIAYGPRRLVGPVSFFIFCLCRFVGFLSLPPVLFFLVPFVPWPLFLHSFIPFFLFLFFPCSFFLLFLSSCLPLFLSVPVFLLLLLLSSFMFFFLHSFVPLFLYSFVSFFPCLVFPFFRC